MARVTTIPATISRFTAAPINEKKKRRTAAYARVSTDSEEQLTSYTAQVDYYTNYIRGRNDWEFVGVYTDEGITGTNTKHREGFKRMVADALAGKIDLIVTKSVSRFARNTVDSLTTVRQLKEKGVEIYFEKENIWTLDSKGELLITIMSSLAQEESRSISENCTWGQRKRFADGKVTVPFKRFLGYDRGPDGNLVLNPDEAVIVRRIYRMFLQGMSPYGIAARLTSDGIKSPGGKDKWNAGAVRSILTNETYKGDALLQKEITVDFLTKTRKPNEGEAPQYYVENGHPGIVSKSVWQEVQAIWTDANRRNCTFSPIANKIICGDCGGRYGRKTWHSTTYRDAVWECNSKKAGRVKCKCRHIYAEELDTAIRRSMHHLLKTHQNIIPDCADLLSQALEEISSDARSVLHDIAHGKLDIQIDGLMIGILIRKMVVTPKQNLVIHFLDGSTYRHRLGATPRGTRLYNTQRDHSRMLALRAEGCSAKEISQRLGISVNTVRSFLRRHRST